MTCDTTDEIRHHLVCGLAPLTPGASRVERVRALCRARLDADRRRSRRLAAISRFGSQVVVPALAAGLFALYAADLVSITLRAFSA